MNVIEAAKEAGFREKDGTIRTMHSSGAWVAINDELERFAQIIRNQALEDAAEVCDEKSNAHDIQGKTFILKDLVDCANAIRSMKKEQTNG